MTELRGLSNLWNFKHADLSKTFFPSRRQFLFNWVPHHHQHIARGMLPHIATKCKFFLTIQPPPPPPSKQAEPHIFKLLPSPFLHSRVPDTSADKECLSFGQARIFGWCEICILKKTMKRWAGEGMLSADLILVKISQVDFCLLLGDPINALTRENLMQHFLADFFQLK